MPTTTTSRVLVAPLIAIILVVGSGCSDLSRMKSLVKDYADSCEDLTRGI